MAPTMTRDQKRDSEALLGGLIVGWYCPKCRKAYAVNDEKTFDQDRQAHLTRDQQGHE